MHKVCIINQIRDRSKLLEIELHAFCSIYRKETLGIMSGNSSTIWCSQVVPWGAPTLTHVAMIAFDRYLGVLTVRHQGCEEPWQNSKCGL